MRKRGEMVERSFAHVLERGGVRRTWLRGRENVHKRYLVHVAGARAVRRRHSEGGCSRLERIRDRHSGRRGDRRGKHRRAKDPFFVGKNSYGGMKSPPEYSARAKPSQKTLYGSPLGEHDDHNLNSHPLGCRFYLFWNEEINDTTSLD